MAVDKKVKKYSCPDCSFCQCCSETRCNVCHQPVSKKPKKGGKPKIHKPLFRAY